MFQVGILPRLDACRAAGGRPGQQQSRSPAVLPVSLQDKARGETRELSDMGTREVEGLVFQMASSVTQLKRLVDGLGTSKDTLDFRCPEHAVAQHLRRDSYAGAARAALPASQQRAQQRGQQRGQQRARCVCMHAARCGRRGLFAQPQPDPGLNIVWHTVCLACCMLTRPPVVQGRGACAPNQRLLSPGPSRLTCPPHPCHL